MVQLVDNGCQRDRVVGTQQGGQVGVAMVMQTLVVIAAALVHG